MTLDGWRTMPSDSTSQLDRLFDFYAADLGRFVPELTGTFGCPLCHRVIPREGDLRDVVAREHVIPQKLGGRLVTSTCRDCNNSHGTELDARLVQRVRVERREAPLRGTMTIGPGTHAVEVTIPEDTAETVIILGIPKQSDSRAIRRAEEALRGGERSIRMNLNFGYVERRSEVALLRAAYLLMFRTFGYSYILDRSGRALREQITQPFDEGPFLKAIMWRVADAVPAGSFVAAASEAAATACFLVVVGLGENPRHQAAVALPPPRSDGSDLDARRRADGRHAPRDFTVIASLDWRLLRFQAVWRNVTGFR